MQVAVVDYDMGNLRSVVNAFAAVGASAEVVGDPAALREAERIVLPGVGAFPEGMRNLESGGWVEALEHEVRVQGKAFLGLCVGMQLLATLGTEHTTMRGLAWVPGLVERLPSENGLRVPQVGWNDVVFVRTDGLYRGLGERDVFYFVHSFVLRPEDPAAASGVCDYGGEFAASVEVENVHATQFHPEKSQRAGLAVLKNFVSLPA